MILNLILLSRMSILCMYTYFSIIESRFHTRKFIVVKRHALNENIKYIYTSLIHDEHFHSFHKNTFYEERSAYFKASWTEDTPITWIPSGKVHPPIFV